MKRALRRICMLKVVDRVILVGYDIKALPFSKTWREGGGKSGSRILVGLKP